MKNISTPNLLTLLRILLSVLLMLINFRSIIFILGYLLCGLTDVLDGYIARKWNQATTFGAKLDSLADFFMCVMIVITMLKQNQLTKPIIIIVLLIMGLKIINVILSRLKFGAISSIHTVANKATGLLLFFCPIAYLLFENWLLIVTAIFAVFSALEEGLIFVTSKTLDLNRKSIFTK